MAFIIDKRIFKFTHGGYAEVTQEPTPRVHVCVDRALEENEFGYFLNELRDVQAEVRRVRLEHGTQTTAVNGSE